MQEALTLLAMYGIRCVRVINDKTIVAEALGQTLPTNVAQRLKELGVSVQWKHPCCC